MSEPTTSPLQLRLPGDIGALRSQMDREKRGDNQHLYEPAVRAGGVDWGVWK